MLAFLSIQLSIGALMRKYFLLVQTVCSSPLNQQSWIFAGQALGGLKPSVHPGSLQAAVEFTLSMGPTLTSLKLMLCYNLI